MPTSRTTGSKNNRSKVPLDVQVAVLTEAGYRCAVPTCGQILAIDLHHIEEVSEGGGNDVSNLIALCPTCHALHHRGTIKRESISIWKGVLMAKSSPYDRRSFDLLKLLAVLRQTTASGDGVLQLAGLVSERLIEVEPFRAELARSPLVPQPWYILRLTPRGRRVLEAWSVGSHSLLVELEPDSQRSE